MTEHWSDARAASWLPAPGPADDKYRRGVLGLRTGSARYPGAAVLGSSAAWRTGVGLLRYVPPRDDVASPFGLPSPAAAVLARHPETVFDAGDAHCDAWVIGSGTDPAERSSRERDDLVALLGSGTPVVVDAGALDLVLDSASGGDTGIQPHAGARPHRPLILTPHRGEFTRLWRGAGLGDAPDGWPDRADRAEQPDPEALTRAAQHLAVRLGATILLKGSVSVVATPGGLCLAVGPATPWLATAGTGDVLAGILGALVAAHAEQVREDPERLAELGATAALLHDAAARLAAGVPGGRDPSGRVTSSRDPKPTSAGRPITASDVAEAVPGAIAAIAGR